MRAAPLPSGPGLAPTAQARSLLSPTRCPHVSRGGPGPTGLGDLALLGEGRGGPPWATGPAESCPHRRGPGVIPAPAEGLPGSGGGGAGSGHRRGGAGRPPAAGPAPKGAGEIPGFSCPSRCLSTAPLRPLSPRCRAAVESYFPVRLTSFGCFLAVLH